MQRDLERRHTHTDGQTDRRTHRQRRNRQPLRGSRRNENQNWETGKNRVKDPDRIREKVTDVRKERQGQRGTHRERGTEKERKGKREREREAIE